LTLLNLNIECWHNLLPGASHSENQLLF